MTINKADYEAVITAINVASDKVDLLSDAVTLADSTHPFNTTFISIFENLENIEAWASAAIEQANQEEQLIVMNNFLSELKVVFDKYTARLEVGSDESGYGSNYGGGATAVGVKLFATFEGVTSTKEINKSVIVSEDLV